MNRDMGGTARPVGWRAWMARLLSAAVLLMSLSVPPPAESAAATQPLLTAAASVAWDGEGGAGTPPRPDGIVHAGAHCTCHAADRLDPPRHTAPAAFSAVAHPIQAARALASVEAEPPARPPRA